MNKQHPRLFISYSHKDKEFVEQLAHDLMAVGLEIWLDKLNILPGANWGESIQQGLDSADRMLLVVTPDAINSANVALEWQYYFDNKKPILLVRLKPVKLPFQISRLEFIDFTKQPYDIALLQLLRHLGVMRSAPSVTHQSPRITRGIAVAAIAVIVMIAAGILLGVLFNRNGSVVPAAAANPTNTLQREETATAHIITNTNVPDTATPLIPTVTATETINTTAVAQATNEAHATINAARTQLFIENQTAAAALWTATPTASATFTITPTVPSPTPTFTLTPTFTFTPSLTYTATTYPTPSVAVWDDFRSQALEPSKWTTNFGSVLVDKIVDDGLKLNTKEWLTKTARTTRIRTFAALVTVQGGSGGTYLLVNGSDGYELGIDCSKIHFRRTPFADPTNDRTFIDKSLPGNGCPTTHLLLVYADGALAHFYVDGEEITVADMTGYINGANLAVRGAAVIYHKVWIEPAP